jgi:hypothetical protein
MSDELLCENCKRRPVSKYNPTYCMVCGVGSDAVLDAEAQKSPALDGVNDYMVRREKYVRDLEEKIAKLEAQISLHRRSAN